jgi:hypothetical protein
MGKYPKSAVVLGVIEHRIGEEERKHQEIVKLGNKAAGRFNTVKMDKSIKTNSKPSSLGTPRLNPFK